MLAVRCNVDVVSEYYREGDAKFRGHKKTSRVGLLQIPQPCGPNRKRLLLLTFLCQLCQEILDIRLGAETGVNCEGYRA